MSAKKLNYKLLVPCSCRFNYKTGFTLAEVLITIGIIAVIAAITIPNLVANYQKDQTVVRLKEVYTNLAQATKQSENENGPNEFWDWGTDEASKKLFYDTYLAPYLKTIKNCNTHSECGYKSNSDMTTIQGDSRFSVVQKHFGPTVMLANGSLLKIQVINGPPEYKNIFIDINGPKPPNKLSRDIFRFEIIKSRGFMPYGYANPDSECSTISYGYSCAAKIMRDGWQIKEDYPW